MTPPRGTPFAPVHVAVPTTEVLDVQRDLYETRTRVQELEAKDEAARAAELQHLRDKVAAYEAEATMRLRESRTRRYELVKAIALLVIGAAIAAIFTYLRERLGVPVK